MFKIIPFENEIEWNEIINSFENSDVYYTREYVKPFAIYEKSKPYLIYFKGKKMRLSYVVLKYDIADDFHFKSILEKDKYYDIQTPYGYGGPLVENYNKEDTKEFFEKLNLYAKENNIVSQFLRFHPLIENHKYFEDFIKTKTFKQTVYLDLESRDKIYKNLNDKCRNMVKKAIKNNIEIKIDNSETSQETFKKLYRQTMDKNHAEKFYYFDEEFFENTFKTLSETCDIFNAVWQGIVIASAIILKSKKIIHYHLSAQDKNYSKFGANNLLLFEAASYFSNLNKTKFHLGGGEESRDNLLIFKKSFNKNGLIDFYIGSNIFDNEKYTRLLQIRKDLDKNFNKDNNFMLGYRAD